MKHLDKSTFKLVYLESLRGLLAVYVVLYHCIGMVDWQHWDGSSLPPIAQAATGWLYGGHLAVVGFLVLSGYVLSLKVIRHGELRGGVIPFVIRRAWRLLPPYYGALALAVAAWAVVPGLQFADGVRWSLALPVTWEAVLSHVFMLHLGQSFTAYSILPPLWSLGVEWWCYCIFAMIFVPIWQRWGMGMVLILSAILGYLPYLLWGAFTWCAPWLVVCFALGMAAAQVGHGKSDLLIAFRSRVPWRILAITSGLGLLSYLVAHPTHWHPANSLVIDPLVGAWCALGLVWLATDACSAQTLVHPKLIFLGQISYSLYLVHWIVLDLLSLPLIAWGWLPHERLVVLLIGGIGLSVGLAWAFHKVFEQPFLSAK